MRPNRTDRLERHALLMLAAALCGHLGNYVFHALTGRMLPIGEYGLMIAVLGALQILQLPLTALNLSVARHTAAHPGHTRALLVSGLRLLSGISLLSALLIGIGAAPLLAFFAADRVSLLPILAALIGLSLLVTLTGGILQGHQKFRWLAARALSLFFLRALFCLAILTRLYPRAESALLAHLLAMAATLGISLAGIRFFTPFNRIGPPARIPLPAMGTQSLKALPALAGFAILMSADVLLVRRYFPAETSGRFAQAAVLARMVLWLPLPIASAMFPKVIHPGADARHTLQKATLYTLALLVLTLTAFRMAAPLLLELLYGSSTPEQILWTRHMALAMAPLAFTHVRLQFELAQKRFAGGTGLLIIALGYLLAVSRYHPDVPRLITVLTLATLLSTLPVWLQRRRA